MLSFIKSNIQKLYSEDGLTRLSFYLFMSMVIYMGLHPRPGYSSCWSMDPLFSSEFIKSVSISRNCFPAFLRFCILVILTQQLLIIQISFKKFEIF